MIDTIAPFAVEVFYDGACPLCMREIAMLRRKDRERHIRFTDIAAPAFDAAALGVPWSQLMARIHARLPDGTLIEGVEVFRRPYAAVGFRQRGPSEPGANPRGTTNAHRTS